MTDKQPDTTEADASTPATPDAAADEGAAEPDAPEQPPELDPDAVNFRREKGRLQMRRDGDPDADWRDVSVVRLFPLSEPDRWISVVDEEDKEIGMLPGLAALGAEQREYVEEELQRRYLTPHIVRILECRHRYDIVEWTVETDRGRAHFVMRDVRDKVQRPRPGHIMLTDVEGNRYDIPNVEHLDPASRQLLDQEI